MIGEVFRKKRVLNLNTFGSGELEGGEEPVLLLQNELRAVHS